MKRFGSLIAVLLLSFALILTSLGFSGCGEPTGPSPAPTPVPTPTVDVVASIGLHSWTKCGAIPYCERISIYVPITNLVNIDVTGPFNAYPSLRISGPGGFYSKIEGPGSVSTSFYPIAPGIHYFRLEDLSHTGGNFVLRAFQQP